MKKVRKISIFIISTILLSLLFATSAFAAPYAPGYISMALGDTVYVDINSNGSTGTYSVSYDGPIYAQDAGGGWIESGSTDGCVSIYANGLGNGNVYINYYVSDDNGNETTNTLCINVDVVESYYEGEAKTEPEDSKFEVTINDIKYSVVADLTDITLPAGFTKADGTYGSEKVNVAKFVSKDNQEIILYALKQKDSKDIKFMTFNSSKVQFNEPKSLTQGDCTYYFLDIPVGFKLPENYQVKEVTIGDYTVNAIVGENKEKSDFVYLYALANGEEGYYSYDTKESTIQRCPDLEGRISPKVEIVKETNNSVNKTMVFIMGIAALVILVLVIFLIILIVKKNKYKRFYKENEIDEPDHYYEEDDYYDENDDYEEDDVDKVDEVTTLRNIDEFDNNDESDELDDIDVIDLSDDEELEETKTTAPDELEESDGLDLIDLTRKPKDSNK